MRQYLIGLIIILSTTFLNAQSIDTANFPLWIEMMQDENANFFETRSAFNKYWENRERQPGDGWKVFKRWEYIWKDRLNEDGTRIVPDFVLSAYNQWKTSEAQNNFGAESISGDWQEIGPKPKPLNGTGQPNGNGRLNTICFHPTSSSTFWVGAPAGGLWKTTDGGVTWLSNTDALPSLGVSSMLVDPTNTSVMYIGTGDRDAGDSPGLGVYKSTNGGTTWVVSNSGMSNKTVGAMIMHPSNSSIILAATSGGIYRTTNAGSSWNLVSSAFYFKDIKFKPDDPNTVYATETTSGGNFYKSTDNGITWTEVTTGLPSNAQRYVIGVSTADANAVYLACSINSAYGGLYKSTNSGSSFSTMSTTPNILGYDENGSSSGGQGWYDLGIAVDPNSAATVYVGGVNIWKSTNSGVDWDCVAHWVGSSTAAAVHADQHWLAFSPTNGRLYAMNDGGIYYTANGGNTWPELSSGIGVTQIYKIGVSTLSYNLVINGYQDNGTAIWDDTIFRTERGGDGMECIIDYSDDNYMYASVYYGNIARSSDMGVNFGSFAANGTNGITEDGAWVTPYILDWKDPNVMFIGYKNVWRTTNAKASPPTFNAISSGLAGSNSQNMKQLRQSKVNRNRLFAVRGDNKLFRTDNALASSPTWTDLTSYLPGSGSILDIETSPDDNGVIWISRGSYIYKSLNGGLTWINISSGLPTINKNTLLADPYSDNGLYVGTDAGVYYLDNSLSAWISFDDSLPVNVEVTELELYHANGDWELGRIRAGTYGRGLWESDRYNPENIAPLPFIDLSLDSIDVCGTDTIQLYNNSAYGVNNSIWSIIPSTGVTFVGGTSATSMNPKIMLSEPGNYDVKLVVSNSNGADSLTLTDAIIVSPGLNLPFFDDLESNPLCSQSSCSMNCDAYMWKNVKNGAGDDIDWRPDNQGTPWCAANYSGGNTGPSLDFNPGNYNGTYFYISSYPPYTACYNKEAIIESPCISLHNVTTPEFKFAHHRFGYGPWMGLLRVDILSSGNWTNLWSISGSQGDVWLVDSLNLSNYVNQNVKLRFRGYSGSGWQADIAVDGIEMTAAPYANFIASDTVPCLEDVITLYDSSTQSPTTWTWTILPSTFSFVNGTNFHSQNPQIQFLDTGYYYITLQAVNQYGSDFESKAAYVHVGQPVVSLISNGLNYNFCEGDSVILEVPESLPQYDFYVNGALVQSGTVNTYIIGSPNDGDEVFAIGYNNTGCLKTTDTVAIAIHQNPLVTLSCSDDDLEICLGDTVVFTCSGLSNGKYLFFRNSSLEQQDSVNSWISSSLSDQDAVWVICMDEFSCEDLTDSIVVSVLPLPVTPILNQSFDSIFSGVTATYYQWWHDSVIVINDSQNIYKDSAGIYKLRVFDGSCWSLWSELFVATGLSDKSGAEIKVFPNPTHERIVVQFENIYATEIRVSIIDISGRMVHTRAVEGQSPKHYIRINMDQLADGYYNIVIETPSIKRVIPVIKERL